MAFPNYYMCSVYYYTDIFAMFFVLAGFAFYVRKIHWAGMISFVLAVSCRQYMLAFPAAIAAYELLQQSPWQYKRFFKAITADPTWIYYTLAFFSIVPWIFLWDGLAPAKVMSDQFYDSDKLANYRPGYILYSCVCVAVYYVIPELLFTRKLSHYITYPGKYPRYFAGLLLVIFLVVVAFPAKQAYNPYFTWPYLGYVDQLFMTIGLTGFAKQVCFGILMLITCMRFIYPPLQLPGLLVLFNAILLGKAQLSWDKYSLPLIMVLWYLAMFDQYWLPKTAREKRINSKADSYMKAEA